MKKFCSNCGSPIEENVNFCPSCGASLADNDNREMYIPDEGIKEMFFRYDNRLNRQRYIMRLLTLVAGYVILEIIDKVNLLDDLLIGLLYLVLVIPNIMVVIRRLHDLDRPGWWFVGTLIPIVNLVLGLYMLFAKGTDGPNQYGPDPLETD